MKRSRFAAFLNQSVGSASTLVTGFVFVRVLGAEGFGVYTVALSIVFLGSAAGNAVSYLPLNFILAKGVYTAEAALEQALKLICLIVILIGLVWLLLAALASVVIAQDVVWFDWAFMASTVTLLAAFLFRELLSRKYVATLAICKALQLNAAVLVIALLLLVPIVVQNRILSSSQAISLLAVAHGIPAIFAGLLVLSKRDGRSQRPHLGNFLDGATWTMLGSAVIWMQSQAAIYAAGALFSLKVMGEIAASKLIAAPFLMILASISQLTLPALLRLRDSRPEESQAYLKTVRRLYATFCAVCVGCGLLVLIVPESAAAAVTGAYAGPNNALICAWLFAAGAQGYRDYYSIQLLALRDFKAICKLNVVALLVCFILLTPIAHTTGWVALLVSISALSDMLFARLLKSRISSRLQP